MGKKPRKHKEPGQGEIRRVVYEMKVTLSGIRPPIWRRIQTTGDTLLWSLHGILQAVMGWEDEHPHRFLINGTYYGEPGHSTSILEMVDEESVRLSDVIRGERDRFIYQYGSDKAWDHEIRVERILFRDGKQRYPICLDGGRACPPEHCSGPWKYRKFLKTLKDPSRARDEDRKGRGRGQGLDPEEFDRGLVNRRLGWS